MGGVRGTRATNSRPGFDLARDGNRHALEDLVRRQWPRVHRILSAETGSRVEADDLTQEAFARVLPRLRGFTTEGAMAAYLDVVARNLARDRFRRRRFLVDAPVDDRPADTPDPETQALSGLDGASVRAAMRRLPADYRTVLRLRLQEGLSSEEVAQAMGRSGAAVRQLQHRALVALRREFTRASLLPGTAAGGEPGGRPIVTEASPAHASTGEVVAGKVVSSGVPAACAPAGHAPAGEMVAAGARRGRDHR